MKMLVAAIWNVVIVADFWYVKEQTPNTTTRDVYRIISADTS